MCIILIKNKGVEMPADKILSTCWTNHSDGAGVLVNGRVDKGFMKLKNLKKRLRTVTKDDLLVVHFRTMTHGEKIPSLTHPFPITTDLSQLSKLSYEMEEDVLFHNGILNIPVIKGLSDTASFAYLLAKFTPNMDFVKNLILSDRIVVVDKFGKVDIFNELLWKVDKGIIYSNNDYLESVYSFSKFGGVRNYADYAHFNKDYSTATPKQDYGSVKTINGFIDCPYYGLVDQDSGMCPCSCMGEADEDCPLNKDNSDTLEF